ncbi:MAG TPA: hypothetical protein VF061_13080, partial [Gemmatimonadales bacterium]
MSEPIPVPPRTGAPAAGDGPARLPWEQVASGENGASAPVSPLAAATANNSLFQHVKSRVHRRL